jgi:hypothetical protein
MWTPQGDKSLRKTYVYTYVNYAYVGANKYAPIKTCVCKFIYTYVCIYTYIYVHRERKGLELSDKGGVDDLHKGKRKKVWS